MKSKLLKKIGVTAVTTAMAFNALSIAPMSFAADTKYEFEDGTITGATIQETGTERYQAGASGDKFVFLENGGETAAVTVTVEETGMYEVTLCYAAPFGDKIHNLVVNGVDQGQISCAKTAAEEWVELSLGNVKLNAGENEISIKSSWGWTDLDYITIAPATLSEIVAYDITCCDPDIIPEAQNLMNYMASIYGEHIISGQQEIYQYGPHDYEYEFEYLEKLTGEMPAIRGFDYGNFSCPAFGSDDGSTDRIIDWVKNKNGIATSSWHLNVPTEFENYTIGSKIDWSATTYSQNTDFSPSKAATEGTKENQYYKQALETLATEFKELEAQGIPVLWRPLHEAEGGGGETGSWFWWGREGSEAYKKLWIYTYETLTNELGCHNLIWEWNSYNYATSKDWYPGDEYVDIIGYDKYNCTDWSSGSAVLVHNDSAISSTFYGIMEKYNSAKMIAMSENDSFSTVDNLVSEKAGWLYFCTWYDGGSDDINFLSNPIFNTEEDTIAMYQSDYCITLDELPATLYSDKIDVEVPTTEPTEPTEPTTEDDSFVFEQKSYTIKLEEGDKTGSTLVATIEGAATASIGGGVGFGTSAADWTNIEWSGNADADGNLVVEIDLSDVPADTTSVEFQIWWSNVWDNATETATDTDCEMVEYEILTEGEESSTDDSTSGSDIDVTVYGDANCDGEANISDVVAVSAFVSNATKNTISEQGMINADVKGNGDGLSADDAFAIQQYSTGVIKTLPV